MSYLENLIPKQYRSISDREPFESTFTIELRDRFYIANATKPTPRAIILSIDKLKEISDPWWMVIPALKGAPELIISIDHAPDTLLPALERIIQNCGHMNYYSLYDIFYDCDDDDTADGVLDDDPPPTIVALEKKYLEPATSISKISLNLESEKISTVEGLWLPHERERTIIRYLNEVIRWTNAPHDRYNEKKFEREEMRKNLSLLTSELDWFTDRMVKRDKDDKARVQNERKSTLRGTR
jgi:hypothetical protein